MPATDTVLILENTIRCIRDHQPLDHIPPGEYQLLDFGDDLVALVRGDTRLLVRQRLLWQHEIPSGTSGVHCFGSGMADALERQAGVDRRALEAMLVRKGADRIACRWTEQTVTVEFRVYNQLVRFAAPLPARPVPTAGPAGRKRGTPGSRAAHAWREGILHRWRALCLSIEARLEAVASGMSPFEEAFRGHVAVQTPTDLRSGPAPTERHRHADAGAGANHADHLPAAARHNRAA